MPGVLEAERRSKHHHQHSRRRKGGSRGGAAGRKDREVVLEGMKCPPGSANPVLDGAGGDANIGNDGKSNPCGSSSPPFFNESGGDAGSVLMTASAAASHLVGHGRCSSSGHDPDPERRSSFEINKKRASKETDPEVGGSEEEEEERQENNVLDPEKHLFSLALRECQDRRFRSEEVQSLTTARKRRPVSLDFNIHISDTSALSPRSFQGGGLKKTSAISVKSRSGMFPSPGTPNYRHGSEVGAAYQKGWSSERVPLPSACRRIGSSAAFLPFNNGKALPSKWEDAEKWICSPLSSDCVRQQAAPPHHRRPKSKSGPLGMPGVIGGCYSSTSPTLPGFDGGRVRNFAVNSPIMAGVLVADRGCFSNGNSVKGEDKDNGVRKGEDRPHSAQSDNGMVRSASVHGWSDLLLESYSSLPSSQDEKHEGVKDDAATILSVISRKDVATQMSPEGSTHSSTKGWPQLSSPPHSSHDIRELHSQFSKLEVRDVQVDDQVTVTRWSKKHISRGLDRNSANAIQCKKKSLAFPSSALETAKCTSRSKREEAKITAWENLQKAKAEALIRKLEMKLEKKRSSSMEKILKKLRSAQRKAQDMRNTVNDNQKHKVTASRKTLLFGKTCHFGSLSGCCTCHVF